MTLTTLNERLDRLSRLLEKTEKDVGAFRKTRDFTHPPSFYEKSARALQIYHFTTQELCHELFTQDQIAIKDIIERLSRGYRQVVNSILKFSMDQADMKSMALEYLLNSQENPKGTNSTDPPDSPRATKPSIAKIPSLMLPENDFQNKASHIKTHLLYVPDDLHTLPLRDRSYSSEIRSQTRDKHIKFSHRESILSDLDGDKVAMLNRTRTNSDCGSARLSQATRSIQELDKIPYHLSLFARGTNGNTSKTFFELPEEQKSHGVSFRLDASVGTENDEGVPVPEKAGDDIDIGEAIKSMRKKLENVKTEASSEHLKEVLGAFANSKRRQRRLLNAEKRIDSAVPADLEMDMVYDQLLGVYDKGQRKIAKRVLRLIGKQGNEQHRKRKEQLKSVGTDPDYGLIEREKEREKDVLLRMKDQEYAKILYMKDFEIETMRVKANEEHGKCLEIEKELLTLKSQAADVEAEKAKLGKQIRELRADLINAQDKVAQKKFKIEQLKKEIVSRGEIDKVRQEKVDALQSKCNDILAQNRVLELNNNEIKAQLTETMEQIASLEAKIQELESHKKQMHKTLREYDEETAKLHTNMESIEQKNKELEAQLAMELQNKESQLQLKMQLQEALLGLESEKNRADQLHATHATLEEKVNILSECVAQQQRNTSSSVNLGESEKQHQQAGENSEILEDHFRTETNAKLGSIESHEIIMKRKPSTSTLQDLNKSIYSPEEPLKQESLSYVNTDEKNGGQSFRSNQGTLIERPTLTPKSKFHTKSGNSLVVQSHQAMETALVTSGGANNVFVVNEIIARSKPLSIENLSQEGTETLSSSKKNTRVKFFNSVEKGTQTEGRMDSISKLTPEQLTVSIENLEKISSQQGQHPASKRGTQTLGTVNEMIQSLLNRGVTIDEIKNYYERHQNLESQSPKGAPSMQRRKNLSNFIDSLHSVGSDSLLSGISVDRGHYSKTRIGFHRPKETPSHLSTRSHYFNNQELKDSLDNTYTPRTKAATSTTSMRRTLNLVFGVGKEPGSKLSTPVRLERDIAGRRKSLDDGGVESVECTFLQKTQDLPPQEVTNLQADLESKEHKIQKMYDALKNKMRQDPSVKKLFKCFLQKKHQGSGLNFDLSKFEVTLEDFRVYYETFEKLHKKCGENCPHLKKFYEKIGYYPFAEKRLLFPLSKTDIERLPKIVHKVFV